MAVGHLELAHGDRVALVTAADLGHGVAAGGVARGAPVVGGGLADEPVQLDGPGQRVEVVGQRAGAALFERAPLALRVDRRWLALLGDLESAAGERVEPRQAALGARSLSDADVRAGDEAVLVELGEAVAYRLWLLAGHDGAADHRGQHEPGAVEQG